MLRAVSYIVLALVVVLAVKIEHTMALETRLSTVVRLGDVAYYMPQHSPNVKKPCPFL